MPRPKLWGQRQTPKVDGDIMVPLPFVCVESDRLAVTFDLLDEQGDLMGVATGKEIPREPPPADVLTAWVTAAILGFIEEGGPLLDPKLNREQRLEAARKVLTDDEIILIESLAVPKRYREMRADDLANMIRTADDYLDRMWAACWLTLIGWVDSADCTFRSQDEMPPNMCSDVEETVVEAYAHSIGVTSRDDTLGWRRVDESYEVQLVSYRLKACEAFFYLNGPPPYECVKDTLTPGPNWRQVVHLLPRESR